MEHSKDGAVSMRQVLLQDLHYQLIADTWNACTGITLKGQPSPESFIL
jgi:hypothetical protein